MLTLRKFFVYSIVLHLTVFTSAFLIAFPIRDKKDKKREEFFARLISPEEFFPPAPPISAIPKAKPSRPSRRETQPRKHVPSPATMKDSRTVPSIEGPSSPHSLLRPATPGEDTESGLDIGNSKNKEATQVPHVPAPSTREKLFDRNIIGDIARRDVTKESKERQTFTFDVKEMRYLTYLRRLKEKIESIWIYPPDAAAKGVYGDLLIKFTIKKNGKLGSVELVRTSGHKDLDDAALQALRDAEPFWPLPDEWRIEAYTIEGHFVYTIYGYYVR